MKTRGERLKERRTALGLTMAQVAEAVGLSVSGVQNLERSSAMPALDIGMRISQLYQRSIEWVVDGSTPSDYLTPIVGTTETGPDAGWDSEGFTSSLGWVPVVTKVSRMFGLMISNSTAPSRYSPGDVLLLDADATPNGGDEIYITLNDGGFDFGIFVQNTQHAVAFEGMGSGSRHVLFNEQLNSVWKIIGTVKLSMIMSKIDE